jgi:hypothetical protein
LLIYFLFGAVVALAFLVFFVSRLDEAARGASALFRPAIFVGCATLWPFLIIRIITGRKINAPIEEHE